MAITYTEKKKFTPDEVQRLFLPVGWGSGQYPSQLHKSLMHSSTVMTAWDGDRLVGLVRLLDDSERAAYMHCVLVDPTYHGQGIASTVIEMVKGKYKNYFVATLVIFFSIIDLISLYSSLSCPRLRQQDFLMWSKPAQVRSSRWAM